MFEMMLMLLFGAVSSQGLPPASHAMGVGDFLLSQPVGSTHSSSEGSLACGL